MSTKSRIVGAGINSYLNLRQSKYALHTVARLLRGGKRHVAFYYRADDPYSDLLAQVMTRLAAVYRFDVEVIPVAEASAAAHPAPDMLAAHAMRDAPVLAERWGLSFPSRSDVPRRSHSARARSAPA